MSENPLPDHNPDQEHGVVQPKSRDASANPPLRVKTYYSPRDPPTLLETPKTPERPLFSPITSPVLSNPPLDGINRPETAAARIPNENSAPVPDDDDIIEVVIRKPGTYDNDNDAEADYEPEAVPSPKPINAKKTRGRRKTAPARTTKRKNADRHENGSDDSEDSDAPIARKRRRTTLPATSSLSSPGGADDGGSAVDYYGEIDSEWDSEDSDSYRVPRIILSIVTDPSTTHPTVQEKVEVDDADTIDKCKTIIAGLGNDVLHRYFSNAVEIVAYRVVGFDHLDDIHRTLYDASWVNITRTTERQFAEWAGTVKYVDNMTETLTVQFLVIDVQSATPEAEATVGDQEVDLSETEEAEAEVSPAPDSPAKESQPEYQLMEGSPIPEPSATHSSVQSPIQSPLQSRAVPDVPIKLDTEDMDDELSSFALLDGHINVEEGGEGHDLSPPFPLNAPASTDNDQEMDEDGLVATAHGDVASFFEPEEPTQDQPPAVVQAPPTTTNIDQGETNELSQSFTSQPPPIFPSPVLPNGQIKAKQGPGQRVGSRKPSGEPGDWMGRSTSAETTIPVTHMNMGEYDLWKAKEADYDACYARNVGIERDNVQLRKSVEVLEHQLAATRSEDDVEGIDDEEIDETFEKLSLKREIAALRRENAELKRQQQGKLTIDTQKGVALREALENMTGALDAVFDSAEGGENNGPAGPRQRSMPAATADGTASETRQHAPYAATTSAVNGRSAGGAMASVRSSVRDPAGGYEESNLRSTAGRGGEGELPPFRF